MAGTTQQSTHRGLSGGWLTALALLAALASLATATAAIAPATALAKPAPPWRPFALTKPAKKGEAVAIKDRYDGSVSYRVGGTEPQIAIDQHGRAVAVWRNLARRGVRIESSTRKPGGGWSRPVRVSGAQAANLHFAATGTGKAIAVWQRFVRGRSILQASYRSRDGAWSAPVTISASVGPAKDTGLGVAVNGAGQAVVVWIDRRHGHYILRGAIRSAGGHWSQSERISPRGMRAHEPTVVLDGAGKALVIWRPDGTFSPPLSAARPVDGGRWTAPQRVSSRNESGSGVRLGVDSRGEAVAVWVAHDEDGAAVATASRPPGGTWSETILLDASRNGYPAPELAVNRAGEAIAIWMWERYILGLGQEGGFFYRAAFRSSAGGWTKQSEIIGKTTDFGAPPTLSSTGEALVIFPRGNSLFGYTHPKGGGWSQPKRVFAGSEEPARRGGSLEILNPRVASNNGGGAVALWELEEFSDAKGVLRFDTTIQGAWRTGK